MLVIGQCYRTVRLVLVKVLVICARCYVDYRVHSLVHCPQKVICYVLMHEDFNQWLFCFSNVVIVLINW